nr:unnamed protein product [Callosobruchus analis]
MLLYKQLGGPPAINGAWLINKSDCDIPLNVQYFLSLGDKYNLPYSATDFPLEQLIVDVEYILQAIGDDSEKTEKRNKVVNVYKHLEESIKVSDYGMSRPKWWQDVIKYGLKNKL